MTSPLEIAAQEALEALEAAENAWGQTEFPSDQVHKAKINLKRELDNLKDKAVCSTCVHGVRRMWCPLCPPPYLLNS